MKKLIILPLVLLSSCAMADTIRTSDGISCSFDADESPWEVSVYSNYGDADYDSSSYDSDEVQSQVGVQLSYKFGGPKRLDCGKLYDLELRTKEARVAELEAKILKLQAAQELSWNRK